MKRCPECRRDYYDDSLLYCLDDGTALLEGPASGNESATAILHETVPPGEAATRAQIHATEPVSSEVVPPAKNVPAWLVAAGIALVLGLGGYFGYRSFYASGQQINSIAVMPFVNESGNTDVDYLSDGMTETLIGSLSQLPNLSVKGRSTVFRYKGRETDAKTIGRELGVQAVLNGRVTQRGDRLTLSLELLDAQTENVIWADKYDRQQTDLVALQNEIAREVSSKLKTRLSGTDEKKLAKTYTEDSEAYQLYLKGRFYWNKRTIDGFRKAIGYFQQAIERDPNYALAYSGLADAYALLNPYGANPPSETMPQAKAAALKALEIDDSLAEAHASLGQILEYYDWDFQGAQRELNRAIELDPNYAPAYQWRGEFLMDLDHPDEAIAEVRRALELDPLSLIINRTLGDMFLFARRYDEAKEQYRKTIEIDPNWYSAHQLLGTVYEAKGMYGEAVAEYSKAQELGLGGGTKQDSAESLDAYAKRGWKGYLEYALTRRKERSTQSYVSPYAMAALYARLDEKDEAFAWLEKAYQERHYRLLHLRVDPQLDNLRSDPRFDAMVKRMNFPE
jgi:TolB-like protein/Tfp pilus assembly protein PilF